MIDFRVKNAKTNEKYFRLIFSKKKRSDRLLLVNSFDPDSHTSDAYNRGGQMKSTSQRARLPGQIKSCLKAFLHRENSRQRVTILKIGPRIKGNNLFNFYSSQIETS